MSVNVSRDSADGYEPVPAPIRPVAAGGGAAMFRRRSALPSRRAVLHVQGAGDPAVPADLATWFTERAFHFYLAGLRLPGQLPGRAGQPGRAAGSRFEQAFADLDSACRHLREADGMDHLIVTAQDKGALAAALWTDRLQASGPAGATADALILFGPALPARPALQLSIACPVLVLSQDAGAPGLTRSWPMRPRRPEAAPSRLGSHVTWLQMPGPGTRPGAGAGRQAFFDELGRWLGAYMYGVRDQLL
jgi:alpha-beta hydrolase superfamily lysophospholipase